MSDMVENKRTIKRSNYKIQRLHYAPGGHGSHVSDNRDQNGINVRQRKGTGCP